MKQTGAYQLNQWELTDRIRMEDFNSDNARTDAALAALRDGKADVSALNALSIQLNGKADQTALNDLNGWVSSINNWVGTKADQSSLDTLSSRVDGLCSYIWLGETVSQESGFRVELTLPAIDWNAWQQVVIDLEIPTCSFYIRGYLNDASGRAYLSSGGSMDYNAAFALRSGETLARLTLEPGLKSWRAAFMRTVTPNERYICFYPGLAYSGIQFVCLNSHDTNNIIPSGSKITVWGIR